MTEQELKLWKAVTESSRFHWVEDEIVRLNGRGAMYYTGGEDGIYMRIGKDGLLEAGLYEGAFPHIGEAMFRPKVTRQFDSFNDAFTAAMKAGGKQFLVDMFSRSEPQPLIKTDKGRAQEEKPAVPEQIREDLSDPSVSQTDMYAYGYTYEGMIPLGRERALELYDKGHEVFLLYEDETEGMAENRGEIEAFDGMFGVEGPPKENEILPPDFGVFILNQESGDKDGARGEWLPLPATAGALRELFGRIGVSRPSEGAFTVTAVRTPLSELLGDRVTKYDSLDELNMLASYMAGMEDYEIVKLQAILSGGVADIGRGTTSLINMISAENFNAFNWIDACDAEALGRYYHAENNEKPDGVSFKEYGEHCVKEENGKFTEWGYICFSYKELLPEYTGEVPDEYKITGKALQRLRRQQADRSPGEKPSVLKQIRESREAPKLPGRENAPKQKKHKGGPEL